MSLFEGRTQENVINLTIGAPGDDLLKEAFRLFKSCTDDHIKENDTAFLSLFQYGPSHGSLEFRQELATFLSQEYASSVKAENLLLTCGASHGLHLIASTLVSSKLRKGVVFVENATYFLALDILHKDLGLDVVAFDPDDSELENIFKDAAKIYQTKQTEDDKCFWGMVYLIPTFHNPTGKCMPSKTSQRLVEMAEAFGLLIVCDDVYDLLWYDECKRPIRLMHHKRDNLNIISNGTFSKILSPGVRVGWIESCPRLLKQLGDCGVLNSGGAVNNVMSGVITRAMRSGLLSQHLDFLREEYGSRMRRACELLQQSLPQEFKFEQPLGGYFIWVMGPQDFNAITFCENHCKGFAVMPGLRAAGDRRSPSDECSRAVRISIAFYQKEQLLEGVRRLCVALHHYRRSQENIGTS